MDNAIRGKVWGSTRQLFKQNNVEIHRIETKKGGYCSRHSHKMKYNMFFVESGELEVVIYRQYPGKVLEDTTILRDGEMTFVEPGVDHMFRSITDCVAYEIYWVTLDPSDIVRATVGGMGT